VVLIKVELKYGIRMHIKITNNYLYLVKKLKSSSISSGSL